MDEMNGTSRFFKVISRHWIVVAGVLASSMVAGVLISFLSVPVYEARSSVVVTRGVTQLTLQNRQGEITDSVVVSARLNPATVAGLARTEAVASRVSDRVKDQVNSELSSPSVLLNNLKVRTSVSDGDLVTFVVQAPDPASAVFIANAWAANVVVYVNRLYEDTGLVAGRPETVLKPASLALSADRIAPNPGYIIGVSFLGGIIVAVFSALVLEYIRNRQV
jgi:capsular polysaccharide biosynthesis protein